MTSFDTQKCHQRNRIAARRDAVESAQVQFLSAVKVGSGATSALGKLPADDAQALEWINAQRPEGKEPLTEADVYLHYAEAANGSFIADRYAFLSTRTLKNIATDAQSGFAFMNSHRTGGLSAPAELPFGRTFCGRYERLDDGSERALIGFFMLRGVAPNGAQGPSTDALHQMIDAGTLFDVSVGLYDGVAICDVCGNDLDAYEPYDPDTGKGGRWLCPHVPGTNYKMSAEEIEAQKARGVPNGFASYTLDNCRCGETSAVYDGAIPGAGFRKALQFARQGNLTREHRAQARSAYDRLRANGDFTMGFEEITNAIKEGFANLRSHRQAQEADPETTSSAVPQMTAQMSERQATLEKEHKQLQEQMHALAARERDFKVTELLGQLEKAEKFLPTERDTVKAVFAQALADDAANPLSEGSRQASLEALFAARPAHGLTGERMGEDGTVKVLANPQQTQAEGKPAGPMAADRRTELLKKTDLGRAILREEQAARTSRQ